MMDTLEIEREARAELDAEGRRLAVEAVKDIIRARQGRPWWRRLFPFKITIERL